MNFYADHVDISYGKSLIVKDLSVQIPAEKITALIGSNGSGKSTILKTMCRILSPTKGQVILDGKSIHKQSTRELAKRLAILPQNPESPEGLTVEELVAYGRAPHKSGYGSLNQEDAKKVRWALEVTEMTAFAERPLEQLSGGQRQRAWIAMCIAQDTELVFLDEPTTFLDIAYQLDVMKLLERLNQRYKKTIVMVVHDLNQAARFADYIVAIKQGQIISEGTPEEVITAENCKAIFGVLADVMTDKRTGKPLCIPYDNSKEVLV